MKFQITTDYAIRILLHAAAHSPQAFQAKQAAKELGITYSYFNKVAAVMRKLGFLESVQGPHGGYTLAKSTSDINLYDVVRALEGGITINRCLQEDAFCSRNAALTCSVHKVFARMQEQMIETLQGVTIYDLCEKAT